MSNESRTDKLNIYHFRTGKDWQATHDTGYTITQASMRDILDAYDEFINDLHLEQLEAY